MYEYENKGYASTNGGRPDPPVRRHKPFSSVNPLKDYSTTDLSNNVAGHLNANVELSPPPQPSSASSRPTPTPTPRQRRYVPPASPYSPLSLEVAGLTGAQRTQPASTDTHHQRTPHTHRSRGRLDDNSSSSPSSRHAPGVGLQVRDVSPGSQQVGGGGLRVRDASPQDSSPPSQQPLPSRQRLRSPTSTSTAPSSSIPRSSHYYSDQQSQSQTQHGDETSILKSPENDAANTSRLSYRDRWEQQRAAKVRQSAGRKSPDSRVHPQPNTAGNATPGIRRQVPEPAAPSATPSATTRPSRQEPEPATSTAYNRSILSSSRNNQSILSDQNRSVMSDLNRSVMSNPNMSITSQYGYNQRDVPYRQQQQSSSHHRILSGEYRVHDPDRNTSPVRSRPLTPSDTKTPSSTLDVTNGFQDSSGEQKPAATSTATTTPARTGSVRAVREGLMNASRSLSRLSLLRNTAGTSRNLTLYGNDFGVVNSLLNLAFLACLSVILAFMSLQLLFQLDEQEQRAYPVSSGSVLNNGSGLSVLEVGVALSTVVLMLDLCCLTVCAVQCFLAAKLLKCPQGDER